VLLDKTYSPIKGALEPSEMLVAKPGIVAELVDEGSGGRVASKDDSTLVTEEDRDCRSVGG
jgi:hypothetical protein